MRFYILGIIGLLLLSFTMVSAKDVPVTIQVTIPAQTPKTEKIYITGNHPVAGDWNPGKVEMKKISGTAREITLNLPDQFAFEYKITRGKWEKEAIYEKDTFSTNQKLFINGPTKAKLDIYNWIDFTPLKSNITGIVKYHKDFAGKGLNYKRDIIVLLPDSYNENRKKRYPVLYMHDGQNIADPATSFTKVAWGVDKTTKKLAKEGTIPEVIVVGIGNSPDRVQEYSNNVLGKAYMTFIIKELKPFIDSTYRTLPDRENTAVMGSSMGGLISFYLVWRHPQVFSKAGCLSTWFVADKDIPYDLVQSDLSPMKNIKIYLDHGDKGMEEAAVESNIRMRDLLISKGYTLGKDLYYFYDQGAPHHESAWSARLDKPLTFLFGSESSAKK